MATYSQLQSLHRNSWEFEDTESAHDGAELKVLKVAPQRVLRDRFCPRNGGSELSLAILIGHDPFVGSIWCDNIVTVTITHAPSGYHYPFCALATGTDADRQQDIMRRTAGRLHSSVRAGE